MVYLVDDAADYRFLVQQVFKRYLPQYPLRLFGDGIALIDHIEQSVASPPLEWPGLILLDMDMPKLSGPQTLERLDHFPDWSSIPVVMMSNRASDSFMRACYGRGACSFLLKPMELDQLHQVMGVVCHYWLDLNQRPSPLVRPLADDEAS